MAYYPKKIMCVSISAESDLLPSELITVRIGTEAVITTTTEELTMTTTTMATSLLLEWGQLR